MKVLIDTHILLWILFDPRKLKKLTWMRKVDRFFVSPISLLEIKFLIESEKINITENGFFEAIQEDERFMIDEVSLISLCETALSVSWTRDPFDRLLVSHSQLRGLPLGTCDGWIRENYRNVL